MKASIPRAGAVPSCWLASATVVAHCACVRRRVAPTLLQALRALQQATAFSFGAERRLAFCDVCERIARLASHAHDVPEQMHEQFMQDMQGELFQSLERNQSLFQPQMQHVSAISV